MKNMSILGKSILIIGHFCLLFSLLASCGSKRSNNEKHRTTYDSTSQKEVTPINVSWEQINTKSKDLIGQTIVVEGHLVVPSYISLGGTTIRINLFERYKQFHGNCLSIPMPIGTENGTMNALKDKFLDSDIVFRDDDGNKLKEGDKVEIKLRMSDNDFHVSKVLGFKKLSSEHADYSKYDVVKLTDDIALDSAKSNDQLVSLEGVLQVPDYILQERDIILNVKKSGIKSSVSAFVLLGEGASTMDMLPSNFTDKDIKIRDREGNELKKNQRVIIYGTYRYLGNQNRNGGDIGAIYVECIQGL